MCLALALFCLESKAIKTGEDYAGRTAADTHVYSRRASGGRPPRRPGRLEKSHNGPRDDRARPAQLWEASLESDVLGVLAVISFEW